MVVPSLAISFGWGWARPGALAQGNWEIPGTWQSTEITSRSHRIESQRVLEFNLRPPKLPISTPQFLINFTNPKPVRKILVNAPPPTTAPPATPPSTTRRCVCLGSHHHTPSHSATHHSIKVPPAPTFQFFGTNFSKLTHFLSFPLSFPPAVAFFTTTLQFKYV